MNRAGAHARQPSGVQRTSHHVTVHPSSEIACAGIRMPRARLLAGVPRAGRGRRRGRGGPRRSWRARCARPSGGPSAWRLPCGGRRRGLPPRPPRRQAARCRQWRPRRCRRRSARRCPAALHLRGPAAVADDIAAVANAHARGQVGALEGVIGLLEVQPERIARGSPPAPPGWRPSCGRGRRAPRCDPGPRAARARSAHRSRP